jgi:hypothetical protein
MRIRSRTMADNDNDNDNDSNDDNKTVDSEGDESPSVRTSGLDIFSRQSDKKWTPENNDERHSIS